MTTLPKLRELDLYELHIAHLEETDQYKVSGYDLVITYRDMGNSSSYIEVRTSTNKLIISHEDPFVRIPNNLTQIERVRRALQEAVLAPPSPLRKIRDAPSSRLSDSLLPDSTRIDLPTSRS